MLAVKSVKQNIQTSEEILKLLETFRGMVNHALRVGLGKNITSRFRLQREVYYPLHNGLHTWYILSAVEKACAMLKNYRKAKRKKERAKKPYAKKCFASIGNQAYKIVNDKLRLPIRPKQYIYIQLNEHTLKVLSEPNLKLGSVALTASTVSISFSKETEVIEPCGYIGIDRNLNNATIAVDNGDIKIYDLSKATKVKEVYREVKRHFKRNDVRLRRKIFRKYGRKQKDKVNQMLHKVSKDIVAQAKINQFGIVMENLKGIRKLYRKGNGQGKDYRARLNGWSFYELQRQIEYKARWEGIPVVYVLARNTSKKCSICGLNLIPEENRFLKCPMHGSVDRDVNAARNILAKGALKFGADGRPVEAMVSVKR